VTDGQDIFDSEVPVTTTEGVSPEAPESQPRDEGGRFAAKDKGEAAPAEAEAAPSAPPAPEPSREPARDIPLTALLDERERRQRAEARLAALERQQQQQQQPLPDPIENAEDYTRFLMGQMQQAQTAQALQMSRFFAEREFGKETVAEAMEFYNSQPRAVSEQFLGEPSPFHAAVEYFKQQKEATERASPAFEASLREKIRAELMAEMGQQPPSSARVPRSLASAPGSSGAPPVESGDPLFS
jgi:hypothetical protein